MQCRYTKCFLILIFFLAGQPPGENLRSAASPSPHPSSMVVKVPPAEAISPQLAQFKALKFGLFIHWGLYAQLAGTWKGKQIPAARPYAEQIDLTFKIPNQEYAQTADSFRAARFDAARWVSEAKQAGVKYVVFTAKHQDGFAMFGSTYGHYNVVDATPFARDPLRALAKECHKQGLKLGVYYSDARDYHEAGANWNTYGNTWDFPPQTKEDFKRYFYRKVFHQVRELLTRYGDITLMWFDVPYKLTPEMSRDLRKLVRSLQPECLVNSRIGNNYGDYLSLSDNAIPTEPIAEPWETCMTMNDSWGYAAHDHHFKSPGQLITHLVEVASKGGNFLLNVGPDGQGVFPPESRHILEEMGAWLNKNGASIYGVSPGIGERLPEGWYSTRKPGYLYYQITRWTSGKITLTGIRNKISKVSFLADGSPVRFMQSGSKLTVFLPDKPADRYCSVLQLKLNTQLSL